MNAVMRVVESDIFILSLGVLAVVTIAIPLLACAIWVGWACIRSIGKTSVIQ